MARFTRKRGKGSKVVNFAMINTGPSAGEEAGRGGALRGNAPPRARTARFRAAGRPPDGATRRRAGPGDLQKTRMAISAGAASSAAISSSSLTRVSEAPAMSSDVQYSPT